VIDQIIDLLINCLMELLIANW